MLLEFWEDFVEILKELHNVGSSLVERNILVLGMQRGRERSGLTAGSSCT